MSSKRIIVGISGGVDSSVAALMLLRQGFQVEGLFMKNWEAEGNADYCTSEADLADAEAVCQRLGIRLHRANFAAEYWEEVFERCLAEFRRGRTPNPDILCNQHIKFRRFLDYALEHLDAEAIATGHYAQIAVENDGLALLKGADVRKDQTYFLHRLSEQQLQRSRFPIGHLEKKQVRQIAKEAGLVTYNKKDSTGICFIGAKHFVDFLQGYLPIQQGCIVDTEGRALGTHSGLMYYTLGQRRGLNIGGRQGYKEAAWYVVRKELEHNRLIVAQGNDHPSLFSKALIVKEMHWLNAPEAATQITAKCRHQQPDQPCTLQRNSGHYRIIFERPQRAVTSGQSVCLYNQNRCLGGGVIEAAEPAYRDRAPAPPDHR